jgi:molecular chaperone GrpE
MEERHDARDEADTSAPVDASGDAALVDASPSPTDTALDAPEDAQEDDEMTVLQRERDEYLELARRVQAEFENYRKRMTREQTNIVERATERLVEELLPVLDAFELAVMSLEADDRVRKGVELVYAELLGVLERSGLERIDAKGQSFDPNEHEAVMEEARPADVPDGPPVVTDIMRTGYRLKGRVLRPAMVKVAR